ncbi:hypothetical protein C8R44DRAFT_769602 [Mycena epipterygia]|nr:hypothetical protein C8R44DRAFT_769602 [Mycena epipterygia]
MTSMHTRIPDAISRNGPYLKLSAHTSGSRDNAGACSGYLLPTPTTRNTPIELVCAIFRIAAAADRGTALALLTVSKAIHNLVLPILYNVVFLLSQQVAESFPRWTGRLPPAGCSRPYVRSLNTTKVTLGEFWWRNMALRRSEIKHLCLTMMNLHAMCSLEQQLQPSHVGIVVDGIHLFPDYKNPAPDRLPGSTVFTHLRPPRGQEDPHASLFMYTSHIYFVDDMPTDLERLRPYLQRVTHFSFAYRRDYGLQLPALSAVLHAVLSIPSVTLVLVVHKSRTTWSEKDKDQLKVQVPQASDPRVVLFDDLQGLTWEKDGDAIWRRAEKCLAT